MSKKNELEFSNFILKFGENHNLLDFVEEIVIPAFTQKLERSYGETRHFIHDVQILNFGNEEDPIPCIAGRYIKDTVIKREQIFDEDADELKKDLQSLNTSPSAIFVLILNNHRLIYFNETAYAPNTYAFRVTAIKFIKEKYQDFIDDLYVRFQHEGTTIVDLYRRYSPPTLEIVPLTSNESISEFVNQFGLIKTVEIDLLTTNNEIDNNEFFKQIRASKEEAHSSMTTITHKNTMEGLSKGVITRQLESALNQGNSKVKLKGKDKQGNKLEGNNDNFKIRALLSEIPQSISGIAAKGYTAFQDLVSQGIIQVGDSRENISEIIKRVWNNINRDT
jgi:hypothetical protein